ncbi:Phage terminase, large subunit GpA [Thiohalospira halophila DSM 15071]|uniref:Phage terminase, large subunit GpA n=1 Tax=Thiohalospira halophila DSM 15071 TaxID=1123397 RepID=A0A1I1UA86_9GAMM|nr:terminase gpA endonuclease subunit [Thiohalospira halophila]SFD67679.1 Phage terminase, large subunit GpA [Thiohalospira halophila DSM 15071]
MSSYGSAAAVLRDTAEILRPPRRLTVPEAAEQYVYLDVPGGYSGWWSNELPHYMMEPAECLTAREYEAVIFVGPAQSGKTQMLVDNWVAHTATCDPADQMVVQTAQDTARDFSRRRIDRLITHSPDLRDKALPGHADNTYDKTWRNGAILSIGWPSKNQLAGRAIGRMALTDYDRMPEDVGGEGSPFELAKKRTTTFLSRGMTMAESSPSRPVLDPRWRPSTPHEAPPSRGILGLYNTGDRRMLYGRCPECGEYFAPAPGPEAVWIPDEGTIDDRAQGAGLICTECGAVIGQERERDFKRSARWLREGQHITPAGEVYGEPRTNRRASFWMAGWFAAFASWEGIVYAYLTAEDTYQRTGDEEALKNAHNVDMAAPYIPRAQLAERGGSEWLEERREPLERYVVPDEAAFVTAAVDVQGGEIPRFIVEVYAHGAGHEQWPIDRREIRQSDRQGPDGDPAPIDPAGHPEDWDVLTREVVEATYRTSDPETEIRPRLVAVDSGGEAGVTERAYDWWRRLRRAGQQNRVVLVKGASQRTAPRLRKSYPDSTGRKDRGAGSRGDVPVWSLNTDQLKDAVWSSLQRPEPGPGYLHIPEWLGGWWLDELLAERRTEKGWQQVRKRNEALDLSVYNRAAAIILGAEKVDWSNPPPWANRDTSPDVVSRDRRRQDQAEQQRPRHPRGRRTRMRMR